MPEWLKNKKLIIALAIVLAAFASLAVFGAPFVASYYYKKGLLQYRQNNYQEAKKDFSISLIFNGKNSLAHFFLGRIALGLPDPSSDNYYPNADYKEVISREEKSIRLGLKKAAPISAYPQALDDLGISYWRLGDYDRSVRLYLSIITFYPERSFWPRFLVAEHYFERANKPEEALAIIKGAPSLAQASSDYNKPRVHSLYTLIARLYVYFEDYGNAEKYAKLAIANAGLNNTATQVAHVILAVVAGEKKDFKLAESETAKADELAGSKGAYNCVLASAYYLGKNYSKAIEIAKIQNPKAGYVSSVCVRVLADSFLALGQKKEAKKYMEEYLTLTESFPSKNIFTVRDRERMQKELQKL